MENSAPPLADVLALVWQTLEEGATQAEHAYHTPVLGTVSEYGPDLRTVILRQVVPAARQLICHSDARAGKIDELRRQPQTAWLFYDPQTQVQLRIWGSTSIHLDDALADEQWATQSLATRRIYLALRPSNEIQPHADPNLPSEFRDRLPTPVESEAGRPNFAALVCQVSRLDWLQLRREGHWRARFIWNEAGLQATWVTP